MNIPDTLQSYLEHGKHEIEQALEEEHTPHETAASFAFGSFIVIMPTFIFGLFLFIFLAARYDRINKVALFAPTILFNPFVKTPFYGAGYSLGAYATELSTILSPFLGDVIYATTIQFITGIFLVSAITAAISYMAVFLIASR